MRKIVAGDCTPENIFQIVDPTHFREGEFEAEVIKAFSCLYPEYSCGIFAGSFLLEGERRVSDLALLHKNLTHWFVIEVELLGHSLDHHVLPQVRCFRYGQPDASCVTSLTRAFTFLTSRQAEQLLKHVPYQVAVIANLPDPDWARSLDAVGSQFLTVSVYRDQNGRTAHEIEGRLIALKESLGFGRFSVTDNCLRITKQCGLSLGQVQIVDQFGVLGNWTIREEASVLWIHKDQGPALITHNAYVQLLRTTDGRLHIRESR